MNHQLLRSGRGKPALLAGFLLAACLILAFVLLVSAVKGGQTLSFDSHLLLALRSPDNITDPLGPIWVEEMFRDFTALGGTGVLLFVVLGAVVYFLLERKYRELNVLLVTFVGGLLLNTMLKIWFDRPRPDLVPHLAHVVDMSFPSGHTMLSAVAYLTLGALLARTQAKRRSRIFIMLIAALLTLLVGISRVYLGVHWPTDVMAGWILGSAWTLLCWLGLRPPLATAVNHD
jgi:undecaprenyl-diphosphatase